MEYIRHDIEERHIALASFSIRKWTTKTFLVRKCFVLADACISLILRMLSIFRVLIIFCVHFSQTIQTRSHADSKRNKYIDLAFRLFIQTNSFNIYHHERIIIFIAYSQIEVLQQWPNGETVNWDITTTDLTSGQRFALSISP